MFDSSLLVWTCRSLVWCSNSWVAMLWSPWYVSTFSLGHSNSAVARVLYWLTSGHGLEFSSYLCLWYLFPKGVAPWPYFLGVPNGYLIMDVQAWWTMNAVIFRLWVWIQVTAVFVGCLPKESPFVHMSLLWPVILMMMIMMINCYYLWSALSWWWLRDIYYQCWTCASPQKKIKSFSPQPLIFIHNCIDVIINKRTCLNCKQWFRLYH